MAPKLALFASAWSNQRATAAAAAGRSTRGVSAASASAASSASSPEGGSKVAARLGPFLRAVKDAGTFAGVEMSLGDLGRCRDEQIEVSETLNFRDEII